MKILKTRRPEYKMFQLKELENMDEGKGLFQNFEIVVEGKEPKKYLGTVIIKKSPR